MDSIPIERVLARALPALAVAWAVLILLAPWLGSPAAGGRGGAWLSAALYVDSGTGGMIGASRAGGGRVESCIHGTETVEGWYLSQLEE